MRSLPPDIRDIAAAQVEALAAATASLDDAGLVSPTACSGWLAAAFADPTDEPADRDYVSYWTEWKPSDQASSFSDVKYYWASAAAYGSADGLRRHLADRAHVAAAASRNAARGRFSHLGHVMEAEDILAIWAVEFVVHQLDLGVGAPASRAVDLAVWTIDELTGGRVSPWDDYTYISKGTGREPLTSADREALGERAAGFPAFG